jgi:hypothetical protein
MGNKKSSYNKQKRREEQGLNGPGSDLSPLPADEVTMAENSVNAEDPGFPLTVFSEESKVKPFECHHKKAKGDYEDSGSTNNKTTPQSVFIMTDS